MNTPPDSNISNDKLYDIQIVNQMCRDDEDQILKMV